MLDAVVKDKLGLITRERNSRPHVKRVDVADKALGALDSAGPEQNEVISQVLGKVRVGNL